MSFAYVLICIVHAYTDKLISSTNAHLELLCFSALLNRNASLFLHLRLDCSTLLVAARPLSMLLDPVSRGFPRIHSPPRPDLLEAGGAAPRPARDDSSIQFRDYTPTHNERAERWCGNQVWIIL